MRNNAHVFGEKIDCGDGCYIEKLPPDHGHDVYRSCGPHCGVAFYSDDLEQAHKMIGFLKAGSTQRRYLQDMQCIH